MSLRWRIFLLGALVTLVASAAGFFYVERVFRQILVDDLAAHQDRRLAYFVTLLEEHAKKEPLSEFAQDWVVAVASETFDRVTILGPSGHVAADSAPLETPSRIRTPDLDAPEILEAKRTGMGRAERRSLSHQENLLLLARSYRGEQGQGIVRVAESLSGVEQAVEKARTLLWSGVATAGFLLLGIVFAVSRDVERAERADRERRKFLSNVSHELRTPLTSIHGYAETLAAELEGKAELERFAGLIVKHTGAMTGLVEDLLDLERLDRRDFSLVRAPVNVKELLEEAADLFKDRLKNAGIAFEVGADSVQATVEGDARLLGQALSNLLENAAKHTPGGGRISLRAIQEGRRLRLEVANTGSAIPAQELPHIFERFYRVEKSRNRKTGGAGLGLAIVRHIAERHGGEAGVQNLEDGVLFWLTVPANNK